MGKEVTMFFTFWGTKYILKSKHKPNVAKDTMEKMFVILCYQGIQGNYHYHK